LKRSEIDRRLAAGEPSAQVARDYQINPSSLHRHRTNCLKLSSASVIKKEAARGTAAVALLPSKETLGGAYFDLRDRIDQIVVQAEQQGSLKVALSGLNAVRQTLDSLARLAGHDRAGGTEINVAVQTNVHVDVHQIVEKLIEEFDHEPQVKARIAQTLLTMGDTASVKPEIAETVLPAREPVILDANAVQPTAEVRHVAGCDAAIVGPPASRGTPASVNDLAAPEQTVSLAKKPAAIGGKP
jgi:hypothetical protein